MRIRGQIGDWPVDLTIELAPEEWAQLGRQVEVPVVAQAVAAAPVAAARQDDGQWAAALDLLRQAGQLSGPELLDNLAGLTGSATAGKRLLVRLRHSAEVRVLAGEDAPLYCWQGDASGQR
ncbi:hypothetical protein AL532_04795 [Pseudomonas monteilii]|uniref:Uncharacterized protein n=2 Tax=Pseudomonas TaxID=286 RepID=A0A6G6UTQ3_9PSED|nr:MULTISPECIES: hypothetical protein [Pseudomonas]AVH35669.1 hypothetical protein AL532_04795 [Pseudomonas monteilii]MBA6140232.1 hypothetical protein [Pseudomonas monteilii]MBV4517238.1 hypothetical protein [Pseudomonas kurunegalensis]MBZ3665823.1 hypothetical protein [Pseudomonas monteilii]MBZ3671167.1 hypothetical protein [Pseudomonas monteilii]